MGAALSGRAVVQAVDAKATPFPIPVLALMRKWSLGQEGTPWEVLMLSWGGS